MNKKLYFFLALMLLFGSSCSHKQITSATTQVEAPSTVDSSPSNGTSVEGVIFTPVEYFTTKEQRAKIISAGKKMNEVNHSQCAYDFLKNRKFIDNQNKSSVEIAELVKHASGTVPVEIYYRCLGRAPFCTSAVAYRNVGEQTIHLNGNAFTVDMMNLLVTLYWNLIILITGLQRVIFQFLIL